MQRELAEHAVVVRLMPDQIVFAPWSVLLGVGVKTHHHLPKAHPDVHQQPIAGMSPESSWLRVRDVEGVTSLTVLPTEAAVGVMYSEQGVQHECKFYMTCQRNER